MTIDPTRTARTAPGAVIVGQPSNPRLALGLILAVAALQLACSGSPTSPAPTIAEEGLLRADSSRGELFLRLDHNIGGYDQTFFPPIEFSQRVGHKRLHDREIAALSDNLGRELRARAASGGVAVVSAPAPCAITMAFAIKDVEVDRMMSQIESRSNATFIQSMGAVTLEVVMRDSMTDTPLLRYTERKRLAGGQLRGSARAALLGTLEKTLDTLLANFAVRLRHVIPRSKGQKPIASECKGLIRRAADAAAQAL